jgi:hypothetical protein
VRRLIEHDPKLTFGVIAFYSAQVDEIGRAMIETGLTEKANNERGWRVADKWTTTLNHEGQDSRALTHRHRRRVPGKRSSTWCSCRSPAATICRANRRGAARKFGHLMLENRLCVAMSRQQRLLVAVGDLDFVRADDAKTPLRALRAFTELCGGEHGIVR